MDILVQVSHDKECGKIQKIYILAPSGMFGASVSQLAGYQL